MEWMYRAIPRGPQTAFTDASLLPDGNHTLYFKEIYISYYVNETFSASSHNLIHCVASLCGRTLKAMSTYTPMYLTFKKN